MIISGLTPPNQRVSDPADCTGTVLTCHTGSACRHLSAPDSSLSPSPCLPIVISTITRTGSVWPVAEDIRVTRLVSCHQLDQQCHHCYQYLSFLTTPGENTQLVMLPYIENNILFRSHSDTSSVTGSAVTNVSVSGSVYSDQDSVSGVHMTPPQHFTHYKVYNR